MLAASCMADRWLVHYWQQQLHDSMTHTYIRKGMTHVVFNFLSTSGCHLTSATATSGTDRHARNFILWLNFLIHLQEARGPWHWC